MNGASRVLITVCKKASTNVCTFKNDSVRAEDYGRVAIGPEKHITKLAFNDINLEQKGFNFMPLGCL